MRTDNYICPDCGKDITEFVRESITRWNRQKNMEKARKKAPRGTAGKAAIAEWKKQHPEQVKAIAEKASRSRTKKTFAKQAETLKETLLKKTVRFAELVAKAKADGLEITPKLQSDLLKKASSDVRKTKK